MRHKKIITGIFSLFLVLAPVMPATGAGAATWFTNYTAGNTGSTQFFTTAGGNQSGGGTSSWSFGSPASSPGMTWFTSEGTSSFGSTAIQPGQTTYFVSQTLSGNSATAPAAGTTPPAASSPPPTNGTVQGSNAPPVPAATSMTPQEAQLLGMVNGARAGAGLPALHNDLRLVGIARAKAEDMVALDYFGHWSPTYGMGNMMLQKAGINFSIWGENLAGAPTVDAAFSALMGSAPHRANILGRDYNSIGIGVAQGGGFGLVVVMEFAKES